MFHVNEVDVQHWSQRSRPEHPYISVSLFNQQSSRKLFGAIDDKKQQIAIHSLASNEQYSYQQMENIYATQAH